MGNTIIKGFVNSRRTHFIYQPAIGSFYEGGQYSFKELLSARDPWSGWIHYDAGLVILRHFSWFANIGWENENNSSGIWRAVPQASYTGATGTNPVNGRNGTPSYMTLAAPDKNNFSTVIVNDSEYERIYKLQTVNMGYTGNPTLEVWETRAADKGNAFNSNYMKYLGNVSADASGVYSIRVKPYSIVTVSTLQNHEKPEYHTPLPVEGERTVHRWTNYKASVDVSFENNSSQSGKNYAAIGARYQGGGSSHSISGTPYVLKFWFDGGWQLLVNNSSVAGGNVVSGAGGAQINGYNAAYDAWHNLAIQVAGGEVTAYLDGVKLTSYTDPNPELSGRVDLASGYYHIRFDNLKVETVDGYAPYYAELLDNLEMYDLASVPGTKLIYSGSWNHENGKGRWSTPLRAPASIF